MTMDTQDEAGLTVLELMVVLVILSLIGAVASVQIIQQLNRAKVDIAKLQLSQLENAIELFYVDAGRYPSSSEGVGALLTAPSELPSWRGPYLAKMDQLRDPWNELIIYELLSPKQYLVTSFGADRVDGGDGVDADIIGGRS